MDKIELLNTAVVVLAQQHNPTILNPDFLVRNGIVGEDWVPVPGGVLCMPSFAQVNYNNGVRFTAESEEFQIVDFQPPEDPFDSRVPDIASKYVETLPHVRYTALGMNFQGFWQHDAPQPFIIERFLKPDAIEATGLKTDTLSVVLTFSLEDARLRLKCESGHCKRGPDGEEKQGVLLDGNFHVDLAGSNPVEEVKEVLGRLGQYGSKFVKIARSLCLEEGSEK